MQFPESSKNGLGNIDLNKICISDDCISKKKVEKLFRMVEKEREQVNKFFKRSIAHSKEFELYSDSYDILTDILDEFKKLNFRNRNNEVKK